MTKQWQVSRRTVLRGLGTAIALPVLEAMKPALALAAARLIVVCPSNPVVSIGPILALPGLRQALQAARAPVVAVSPIVGGAPVKGPADRLLRGLGVEVSALGVAGLYRELAHGFVLDAVDAEAVPAVEALGMRVRAIDTIMRSPEIAAGVARAALDLAGLP